MNNTKKSVAIVAACLALAACGGPDHPKPPPGHGPQGVMVTPPASPSIHFKINDGSGKSLDLMIECGEHTSLKDCAQVNQALLDRVSKIRGEAPPR